MLLIGLATAGESIHRLITHESGRGTAFGVVLASASVFVMAAFSVLKRRIAADVGSPALAADGWLSGMGSLLALVTVAGTALNAAFGWSWVDPAAASLVAIGAVGLSIFLRRSA